MTGSVQQRQDPIMIQPPLQGPLFGTSDNTSGTATSLRPGLEYPTCWRCEILRLNVGRLLKSTGTGTISCVQTEANQLALHD